MAVRQSEALVESPYGISSSSRPKPLIHLMEWVRMSRQLALAEIVKQELDDPTIPELTVCLPAVPR